MTEPGLSKKRKLEEDVSTSSTAITASSSTVTVTKSTHVQKVPKIHPFFAKRSELEKDKKKEDSTFQWLEPLGPTKSCLYGINLQPKASPKVAALDLDGTVIKSEFGSGGGNKRKNTLEKAPALPTFEWWRSVVPEKLRELHKDGYSIVFITNQALKPAALKTWKEKIPVISKALNDLPFRIMAASQKDQFRKPMPGMWYELERIFKEEGVEIDKSASFFVGDAAGRQYTKAKGDFSSTDRKWALNLDLRFFTPEEYFLKLVPHTNYNLPGFQVSSLPQLPLITPSSSLITPTKKQREVVLFVGYPSLGKSTFYRRYFEPEGYVHVNQDTLKTRERCVREVRETLKAGKSCVIDNTNPSAATRKLYLDVCKEHDVPARCFLFSGSMELAWHNNLYRAFNMPPSATVKEPGRALLPYFALTKFRDSYEEPVHDEGFSEIKQVNWVFEGSEEEKKRWSMWLQIDGK